MWNYKKKELGLIKGSKFEILYNSFDATGKLINLQPDSGYRFLHPNLAKFNPQIMREITWEEFTHIYKPVPNPEYVGKIRINKPECYNISIKQIRTIKVYDMNLWTVISLAPFSMVSGRRISEAIGYIISEEVHFVDELITIINKEKDE